MIQVITNSATDYTIREELLKGRKHIVVPVTMMVEGVHNGSNGPLYYPLEELSAFTTAWNGVPVVINHPQDSEGHYISANSPGVIEQEVGKVFNAHIEGNALKAEVWIDEQYMSLVSEDTINRITEHMALEVSVGVFSEKEETPGDWNGEHYDAIARDYRPDHLALLPDQVGACSWEDGCGIRVNQKMNININYSGTETGNWNDPRLADFGVNGEWTALNSQERARISKHFLVGLASAASFDELRSPVVDASGKLNQKALFNVLASGEKQPVKRNAFTLLNSEFGSGIKYPDNLIDEKIKALSLISNEAELKELTYTISRLVDSMDSEMSVHYCEAIYNDHFVYRKHNRNNSKESYYKQNYSVNDSGEVALEGEPAEVKKNIEYMAVNSQINKSKTENMSKCKVNELISNKETKFTEDDRTWLEGLEDSALEKLMPAKAEPPKTEPKTEEATVNVQDEIKKYLSGMNDQEKMSLLSKEAQSTIAEGNKIREEKRTKLIKEITDNSDFTEDELKGKATEELQKLSSFIPSKTDYSALSGVFVNSKEDDEEILAMTGYLNTKEDGK